MHSVGIRLVVLLISSLVVESKYATLSGALGKLKNVKTMQRIVKAANSSGLLLDPTFVGTFLIPTDQARYSNMSLSISPSEKTALHSPEDSSS